MNSAPRFSAIVRLLILVLFTPAFLAAHPGATWENVPKQVRDRKAFKRFEWFHRQRAHPDVAVPAGALEAARELEMAKEAARPPSEDLLSLTWSSIGPAGVTSTYPSWWGVVSGRVRALAVHPTDPNTVYIGPAAGGIWKTTDAGFTWQDVGVNLASLTFGAFAIDPGNPQVVYAGSGESIQYFNTTSYSGKGLYKTTNGGTTWTQITSGFGTTTHFSALKVSPTNSNTVFAALGSGYYYAVPSNEGLWRSTDAGVTWTRTLNVDDGFDVLPHPTTANRVYGATGGGVSTAGFYRSTDNGASWTKITTGLPGSTGIGRMQIALCTSNPSTLYALIYSATTGAVTLYKSTNDGTSWVTKSGTSGSTVQGWYDLMVAVHPTNPLELYIGTENLEQSTDSGSTLNYVGGYYWNQSMHVDFHIMAYAPSNPLYRYVGCDGGIYRSTNGGISWGQLNSALPTLQYYRIGSHPTDQNTVMGGSQDNGVFLTTNGGSGNWTLVSTGDGMECFYDYSTPTTVYASTQYGAIVKSTTGGTYGSFSSIQPSTTDNWAWTAPFFIHPTTSTTVYTASQRPWRSTNGGTSWTDLNGGVLTSSIINTMAQSPVTPNNMILAASEGSPSWPVTPPVYVSTNGGTIWTNVTANVGGTSRYITRVLFHPTQANTCYLVRSGFGAGNKIYKSTNMGTTWTNVSGDLPDVPHNDLFIDPAFPSEMYAANDLGVYQTTNGGTNWTRQGNGMPYVPAIDFDYFNSGGVRLLRAATHGRSAYEASLPATASVQVTVPNGGEVWRIGGQQTIQWNASGFSGNVAIDLSRNAGATYESITASTANDGAEPWTVTGAATPLAIVRVSSVSSPAIRDSSNAPFNIIQVSLTVASPNGGETWVVGQPGLIQWTSVNMTGNVRLELSRNGGATWDTALVITPDDGSEFWPVTGPATTQALMRIVSIDYPWVTDASNSAFTIVQPTVNMLVPNGGESWAVGSLQAIQWSSANHTGPVNIELSRDGGLSFPTVLFASTPDDGSEPWIVPAPATTTARIRVVSAGNPAVADTSAANFSITQPQLSLLSPNGGEVWPVDSVRSFLWSSSGLSGTVTVELSRNGGATYDTVAANTSNDGTESWTVTLPATTQARARIVSDSDPTMFVVSAADFTIVASATVTHLINEGWNILSVPVTLPDLRTSQVFPAAASPAFAYTPGGYQVRDTLQYGEGYWIKFSADTTAGITGGLRTLDTVSVTAGWNMIGSVSGSVHVDSIGQVPDSIVVSSYYGYSGAYGAADSLRAMQGYWVKVKQAGKLILRRP